MPSGKAFYLSAVDVDTSGPGISLNTLLLTTAVILGGSAELVYMSVIPGADGAPPIAPFAIVAVGDRPSGIDTTTGELYVPVADFYEAGKLGPTNFLTKSFTQLQALIANQYGQNVADLLQDQDVGAYGLG